MRKEAAAGTGGFQKEHLMISGLTAILAKIFNILCYSSYFSTWLFGLFGFGIIAITIDPILGRIFDKREVVLNLKQKAFTSENRCKINIELVEDKLCRVSINEEADINPYPFVREV